MYLSVGRGYTLRGSVNSEEEEKKSARNNPVNTKVSEEEGEEVLQALDQRFLCNSGSGPCLNPRLLESVFFCLFV